MIGRLKEEQGSFTAIVEERPERIIRKVIDTEPGKFRNQSIASYSVESFHTQPLQRTNNQKLEQSTNGQIRIERK